MSRWQKTCGNAFNLAVFSSRKSAGSALGHKRHGRFPLKADMCGATTDVRFVPIADIVAVIRSPSESVARLTRSKLIPGKPEPGYHRKPEGKPPQHNCCG